MVKIFKWFGITCLLLIIILALFIPISNWLYEKKVTSTQAFPTTCLEGWAHRGYVNPKQGLLENTLESYQQAIDLGATGIEMDVFYDTQSQNFIVSHDNPQHQTSMLTLKQALQKLPKINIWLDVKNLYQLMPWQAFDATAQLYDIIKASGRLKQVLIESRSAWYLADLANRGAYTTLMIEPNPEKNIVSMWVMIAISKFGFAMGDYNGISISYTRYHGQVLENFKSTPTYLSTVNHIDLIPEYLKQPQVKIFLTDNPVLYGKHCIKP